MGVMCRNVSCCGPSVTCVVSNDVASVVENEIGEKLKMVAS